MTCCGLVCLCLSLALAAAQCDNSTRRDCGYTGINQEQCLQKDCCWAPTSEKDDAWCFYPINPAPSPAPGKPPYSDDEGEQILKYFLQNVNYQSSGAVIAAPSTEHPDYFYHWVRDGAISMNVVLKLYNGTRPIPKDSVAKMMDAYTSWVTNVQQQDDPNGMDILGEPKFYTSGKCYDKPWGRPQNDGPGLRARALLKYAFQLLTGSLPGGKDYVLKRLYHPGGQLPIYHDLNYLVNHWKDDSFDLWEEIKGQHFFTKMAQRKALLYGTELANQLGDSSAASTFSASAKEIEASINKHWDAASGVIQETLPPHPGPQKFQELDCAVVLGALEGDMGDGYFGANDQRVLSSAAKLRTAFNGVYAINDLDSQRGLGGFLIGRYPNDTYDGYETSGKGNPWFLCTQAFGELYYRQAKTILEQEETLLNITSLNHEFFHQLQELSRTTAAKLTLGTAVNISAPANGLEQQQSIGAELAAALLAEGDGMLLRSKYHAVGNQLHLSEQINLETGYEQGANDLTWSYGTLLSALHVREKLAAAMS